MTVWAETAHILVDDRRHPECLAVVSAIGDEVVVLDMTAIARSPPDAGSVVQSEAASLGLPMRYFKLFATPEPLDPFGIHRPAFLSKQGCDAAIAIATVVRSQPHDIRYPPSGASHRNVAVNVDAGSSGAGQSPDMHDARTRRAPHRHGQRQHGVAKGLVISLHDLLQDQRIQRQVGDCLSEPGVFLLQGF